MGAFFDGHFAQDEAWERVRRVARPLSPALASVLEAQNARYAPSQARDAHLRALRTGAGAVVTGQQAGLFLGPLYTLYKAATAIRLARWLAERWAAPVVPVFWLQTEDHDAAEIAVCHVSRGSDEPLTLSIDVPNDGVSVAHRLLPVAVEERLAQLGGELARLPHGEEHLACLARHYKPGAGWGQAFAGVLAELFAGEGLVLLDPRDPALFPLAAPVHRRALSEAGPIARALTERVHALESRGWSATVHVREGAPLAFVHPDGPEGPRVRLAAADGGFTEIGGARTHTIEELLGLLDTRPGCFSTSALLRPILQDTWLPTVAYVGGPAEVAYFAQMPPLYAAFELPMPIVVPRTRLRLIEARSRRTLTRCGLTPEQACRTFDQALVLAHAAAGGASSASGGHALARQVMQGIDRTLADVTGQLRDAGEGGVRSLEKTRLAMARLAERLGGAYDRARSLQDRDLVDDLRRLQARLLPRGIPQERFFGVASFAARYGQRTIVERVLAAAEPLRTNIEDLDL